MKKLDVNSALLVVAIVTYNTASRAEYVDPSYDGAKFGIKSGYQVYANGYNSPTSFGWGGYINLDMAEPWSFEAGLLFLGEAEENNRNIGAFNSAELSALYSFNLNSESELFVKGGIAPWFGYMTVPNGGQGYEYGLSPLFGIGYQVPLYKSFYGRLEYQYIPNLGGSTIGYTDSHFLSLGVSWRNKKPFLVKEDEVGKDVGRAASIVKNTKPIDEPSSLITQSIYGSFLFDTNSSVLKLPKPFHSLDTARQLVKQGCQLVNVKAKGYSDSSGQYKYNQWLSERRVRNVSNYITHALGSEKQPKISWHGSERFMENSPNNVSFYERRVDIQFEFKCFKGGKDNNE